jgi:hypothetical protein
MLRVVVVAIGVACLIGALFLARLVWFAALELGIFGILILAGTFFEKHYRERRIAGSGFEKTDERFVDPTTGKLVEVRYDPSTGERAYVDPGGG